MEKWVERLLLLDVVCTKKNKICKFEAFFRARPTYKKICKTQYEN
jgi:hypothetical protein